MTNRVVRIVVAFHMVLLALIVFLGTLAAVAVIGSRGAPEPDGVRLEYVTDTTGTAFLAAGAPYEYGISMAGVIGEVSAVPICTVTGPGGQSVKVDPVNRQFNNGEFLRLGVFRSGEAGPYQVACAGTADATYLFADDVWVADRALAATIARNQIIALLIGTALGIGLIIGAVKVAIGGRKREHA